MDEDDLDLIEENTGKRVTDKKKFKRLQRAGGGRGGMEGEEEEEEEEERPPEDEGEEEGEEDEMADFIVDGVDENGEPIKSVHLSLFPPFHSMRSSESKPYPNSNPFGPHLHPPPSGRPLTGSHVAGPGRARA